MRQSAFIPKTPCCFVSTELKSDTMGHDSIFQLEAAMRVMAAEGKYEHRQTERVVFFLNFIWHSVTLAALKCCLQQCVSDVTVCTYGDELPLLWCSYTTVHRHHLSNSSVWFWPLCHYLCLRVNMLVFVQPWCSSKFKQNKTKQKCRTGKSYEIMMDANWQQRS